ncbi:MAG: 2-succinyl-5-enolpyruvyl-6-hydroxy-3-cyclohexene-1-carboxylate synthase [Thermonema sp.]|uniref:2-succinyl-5-enolpyruvyl-6-hydroxy-3- cyclohexene-1-carboxylic-acid synthase n=1 Tax=Thermonema sp. TaxID=2231181 RepID=UPI0021DC1251|nr:2-succinyl-5-enolpyruvyl-6-hydroxy-3-cyclohexene-1-carboxylic-acid synthase [Thermonema sp.]GIV38681.1 MAG: 2-succinyl-5-enolpyruvyl-6-hydroxy-3-cyclohexene-1-carboxylate synthase [Thermonema sp.]
MKAYHAAYQIVGLLAARGLRHVVVSPGSRSAPLTLAFARHPQIKTYVVHDERSAAYQALGMAQTLRQAVALVCTSGTAAVNFAPAVVEAFYLEVPLLVLTADRPPEWIDQQDGQAIHQGQLFAPHVKAAYQLPVSYEHQDARWHLLRSINEAYNEAMRFPYGPVHVNCPFREPLYPAPHEPLTFDDAPRCIEELPAETQTLSENSWQQLEKLWEAARRPLILAGQSHSPMPFYEHIEQFCNQLHVPVVHGRLANYPYHSGLPYPNILPQDLAPDLLISVGGSVLSKPLKLLLRACPPAQHWHIRPAGKVADPFRALTHILRCNEAAFFREAARRFSPKAKDYRNHIEELATAYDAFLQDAFPAKTNELHELWLTQQLLQQLPAHALLYVANSSPVRYVEMLRSRRDVVVRANRGTSGIDGCTSTALGAARVDDRPVFLLTGDIAFFYDSNAFWEAPHTLNFKVILINNQGGGIFRLIDGPRRQDEGPAFFETPHQRRAASLMAHYGIPCFEVHSTADFESQWEAFVSREGMAVIEVMIDRQLNAHIFEKFQQSWKEKQPMVSRSH